MNKNTYPTKLKPKHYHYGTTHLLTNMANESYFQLSVESDSKWYLFNPYRGQWFLIASSRKRDILASHAIDIQPIRRR